MNNKLKSIFFIFLFFMTIFSVSLVSAQTTYSLVTDPQVAAYTSNSYVISPLVAPDSKLNQEIRLYFAVSDSNGKPVPFGNLNCSAIMFSPNENRTFNILGSERMTNPFLNMGLAIINSSFVNKTGIYNYYITCVGNTNGGSLPGAVDVTPTGQILDLTSLLSRVTLLIFFGILIFFIYYSTKKLNFDKWYNKIKANYGSNNYVKVALGSLGYNFLKNIWVLFYSIGFLIITLLMNIVYIFDISSMLVIMKVLTSIYAYGFILVGLVFLSYLQEFFKYLIEEIKNENWGVQIGK